MKKPLDENFFVKTHLAVSIGTIVFGTAILLICLTPSLFPALYKLLLDDRIAMIIPYLLLIALGEAIFSIWYFLFRNG
ncbi:MAG: hypothetical protein HXX17_08490 [Geobacteraceae bacterium]|nr:hypothetical protein [Geobacteraceae bacterium]